MSVQTINPLLMSARDWFDAMIIELEQFGNLARLDDEKEWREWGAQLLTLPTISGSIVPDPYQFEDWRPWAERLNEGLAAIP